MLEAIFVVSLFLLYTLLWKAERFQQKILTGMDPDVMGESTFSLQRFMNSFMNILTAYAAIIILMHTTNFQLESLFNRYEVVSSVKINVKRLIYQRFTGRNIVNIKKERSAMCRLSINGSSGYNHA